jgi:TonB-linked SusC/RagA family outer membrane protein
MKNKIIFILLMGVAFFCQPTFAQDGAGEVIRGKVVSDINEELVFATVLEIDNTGRVVGNTQTDTNGDFSMKIKSSKNKLKISYLGYAETTLTIGDKRTFNVTMKEENVLQEVVITGQQSMSNGGLNIPVKEVSFAMQKIDTKEFAGVQVTSIEDALQGRIAGLDIIGSGEVGKAGTMRIRGTASINSNTQPLIVMNNVPQEVVIPTNFDFATANEEQFANMLSVNPEDIESIVVLKDAASTAIWGSKGANGVLMITTKKGAAGPTRVNYTFKLSGTQQPKGMNMLNGDDYTMLMKQAYFNPHQSNTSSNIPEFNYDRTFSEYKYYSVNTDWRESVIQYGLKNDHYLVISGGGDKARFRVTGGYTGEKGSIIGQGLRRITSRMDLDYNVSSRIRFRSEFAFTNSTTDRNWTDSRSTNNARSILDIAYKKMPNLAIYNKDDAGNDLSTYYNILSNSVLASGQKELRNPVALANLAKDQYTVYDIKPVLRLEYDLIEPSADQRLRYEVWVSFQKKSEKTDKFLPKEVTSAAWDSEDINRSDYSDNESFGIQSENKIVWTPKLPNADHSLQLMTSLQTSSGSSNSQGIVSFGYPSYLITDASAIGYLSSVSSSFGEWRNLGLVGQLHYAYQSKYVVDVTFRRDGSSKFGSNNRWGNFPGISLRYNMADEKFFDFSNKWLDEFSLRASYGINGNSPSQDYMHFSVYEVWGSYAGVSTIRPSNIRLTDLRWETTTEKNLGLNLAVLNYKWSVDANVYTRTTKDLLFQNPRIPTSSGFSSLPWTNAGTMKNEGWEIYLNGKNVFKIGNVAFDLNFNIANSVNTLLSLDEGILNSINPDFTYENGKYLQRLQEGNSFGSIYGFRYKGVYQYNTDSYEKEDIRALVDAKKATMPVARNANGDIIYDNKGVPLPMYFYYGENGRNYLFQGGDAIYEDINNDGNIDELDIVYLGNSNPKLTGGGGFTVKYKRFAANLFMNFRVGNKIVNMARMEAENMHGDYNQSKAVNWRWRKEGDVTEMPRALHDYGYNWLASDRYVEDGSFLRLKYTTISYSVPADLVKKFGMKQLDCYVTFNNIACFTKYTGVDPEVGYGGMTGVSTDNNATPRSRDFTFSVTVGF